MTSVLWSLLFIVGAPLLGGLIAGVDRVVSARMQGRVGPPLLQPFYDVGKLWCKAPRAVNPLAEPLLYGHVGFMALTGALLVGGADVLFAIFVFVLAALCLVLAAGSADSPYSSTGAERELLLILAAEPFFVLALAAACKVTGASTVAGILASDVPVAAWLPGVALALLPIITLKLRKSPFDISTSHHAHQELARGLTSDMAGRQLALVEIAHWYESVVLLGLVAVLFNFNLPLGLVAAALLYAVTIAIDNATARARWQLLLRSTWAATLVLSGGNLLVIYLLGW
jgi:formate hydrogenlyase subunit 4